MSSGYRSTWSSWTFGLVWLSSFSMAALAGAIILMLAQGGGVP